MKGYYLFAPVEHENAGPESGVERKVRAQHKALQSMVDCKLVVLDPVKYTGTAKEKILRRLPFTAAWRKWEYRGEFHDADFLYIRQVYHDASFVRYLKAIRQDNPHVRIIYEIPTYPYDKEVKISAANAAFTLKERINRIRASKYMDRIVTFYNQDSIWNVPCLKLINGYDFSKVEVPHREAGEIIHILSVSATAFWHGYDRFIEGLHRYYQSGGTENIVYHLVGNILPEHQKMIADYGLENHVILYGRMSGEPLKQMYAKCTLGIDILGGHRKDFPVSSTLKSREYGAYGLPLITSSPVDFMEKDCPWQLLVPYDDSPIDIQRVVDFYHHTYDGKNPDEVANEIRNYAKEKCDMSTTMAPVAQWLLNK